MLYFRYVLEFMRYLKDFEVLIIIVIKRVKYIKKNYNDFWYEVWICCFLICGNEDGIGIGLYLLFMLLVNF